MIRVELLLQVARHILPINWTSAFESEPVVDALRMEDVLAAR